MKPEEAAKLQNGDGSKEGGATAAATAASEEKKKAKSRFMFNIADGGFTGTNTPNLADWGLVSPLCAHHDSALPQSSTPCGRTRSAPPPSPRKPTRSGTAATTTGCWPASYSILFSLDAQLVSAPFNIEPVEQLLALTAAPSQTRLRPLAGHPERR